MQTTAHRVLVHDFDRLQMSPAPSKPIPFYVGGHTDVALKRAVRIGDGWTSAVKPSAVVG